MLVGRETSPDDIPFHPLVCQGLKIMRATVYVIAAIAAAGIMYVIASNPNSPTTDRSDEATASVAATSAVMSEAGTLTLSVPEMHCEFACFPKVKETLEGASGVEEVTLAAQAEEGVIDNRQVIVKYEPGFDLNAAIASLASAGYKDSQLVP
jgi:periplasmic mercuric ion binding protein